MAILPLILHYHRLDLTEDLCAQVPAAVVVDAMGDYPGPNRRLVIPNRGFTANWNRALDLIWGEPWDHVALMNNDIILRSPDLFQSLASLLDSDPEIGIASACFNSPWQGCNCDGSQSVALTGGVEFTAPILRRDLLERLGRFDESIAIGFGVDAYYCHLAIQLGYKIAVDHRVSFHHLGNQSGLIAYGCARRYVEMGHREMYEYAFTKIDRVTHTDVIRRFIELRGFRTYLEIGYGGGVNFRAVAAHVKHAVDPHVAGNPDVTAKTSDRFFEEAAAVGSRYDLIFIDGLHTRDQVLRDYRNARRCITDRGVILLHDVNPTLPGHVRGFEEFSAQGGDWTGDAYRAWAQIRRDCGCWTATILDDFGIGIVDVAAGAEPVDFDPPANFEEFHSSRRKYLNPILFAEIR